MGLEQFLIKELAQDIEASGKTRAAFNLAALVKAKEITYGRAGSQKRKDVQKKFDQLKCKTPQSYLKFLDKVGVDSGEALQRELRTLNSSNSSIKSKESKSKSSSNIGTAESTEGTDSDVEVSQESESDEESSTVSSKPPPIVPASDPSSIEELATKFSKLMPVPPVAQVAFVYSRHLKPKIATMSSNSSSVGSMESSVVATVLSQIDTLSTFKMDGSVNYPYVIIVDPTRPECNWGFEVSFVQQVEVRNFHRDIFHIRKVTGVPQDEDWKATIPSKKYPDLANRAVLIRGPSQDFWHQDAERYHADSFCDVTKKAHQALQTNIQASKDRLYSYWLLVFPPGTEMENHVLSDDAVHVKMSRLELVDSIPLEDEKGKTQDVDLLGMDVHWRIAVKGGEMIRSPDQVKSKKKFARRKRK